MDEILVQIAPEIDREIPPEIPREIFKPNLTKEQETELIDWLILFDNKKRMVFISAQMSSPLETQAVGLEI